MELATRLIMGRGQEREGSYRDIRAPPSNTDSGLPVVGQRTSDPAAPLDEGSPGVPFRAGEHCPVCPSNRYTSPGPGIALRCPHFSWAECERLSALPTAPLEMRA